MSTNIASPETTAQPASKVQTYVDQKIESARGQIRAIDLYTGILIAAVYLILFFLVAAVVDAWIWPLSQAGRWALLGLFLAGLFYIGYSYLIPLFLRRINPQYAAKMIEDSQPGFFNSILNYVSISKKPEKVRTAVLDAVSRQAATDISSVPEDQAVDKTKLIQVGFLLVAATAIAMMYWLLSPKSPLATIPRILMPSGEFSKPAVVTISDVQPGNATVFFGDPFVVSARVRGKFQPEQVKVVYSTLDGQLVEQTLPMQPDDVQSDLFSVDMGGASGIRQSMTYQILAVDGASSEFKVQVEPRPAITVDQAEITPPKYTGLPVRIQKVGAIDATEGAQVKISATANLPIDVAFIEFVRENNTSKDAGSKRNFAMIGAPQKMQVKENRAFGRFQLTLDSNREKPFATHYRLRFKSTDGDENQHANLYPIQIIPDLAPEIRMANPMESEVNVPVNSALEVRIVAHDLDYEISKIELIINGEGRNLSTLSLPLNDEGKSNRRVQTNYTLRPDQLGLQEGDQVIFFGRVSDNRTSYYDELEPAPNISRSKNRTMIVVAPVENEAQPDPSGQNAAKEQKDKEKKSDDQTDSPRDPDASDPKDPSDKDPNAKDPTQEKPTPNQEELTPNQTDRNQQDPANPNQPDRQQPNQQQPNQQQPNQQQPNQQQPNQQQPNQQQPNQQQPNQQQPGQQQPGQQQPNQQQPNQQQPNQQQPNQQQPNQQQPNQQQPNQQQPNESQSGTSQQNQPGQQGSSQGSKQQQNDPSGNQGSGQPGSSQSSSDQRSPNQNAQGSQSSSGSQPNTDMNQSPSGANDSSNPPAQSGNKGQEGSKDNRLSDDASDPEVFRELEEYLEEKEKEQEQNSQNPNSSENKSGDQSTGQSQTNNDNGSGSTTDSNSSESSESKGEPGQSGSDSKSDPGSANQANENNNTGDSRPDGSKSTDPKSKNESGNPSDQNSETGEPQEKGSSNDSPPSGDNAKSGGSESGSKPENKNGNNGSGSNKPDQNSTQPNGSKESKNGSEIREKDSNTDDNSRNGSDPNNEKSEGGQPKGGTSDSDNNKPQGDPSGQDKESTGGGSKNKPQENQDPQSSSGSEDSGKKEDSSKDSDSTQSGSDADDQENTDQNSGTAKEDPNGDPSGSQDPKGNEGSDNNAGQDKKGSENKQQSKDSKSGSQSKDSQGNSNKGQSQKGDSPKGNQSGDSQPGSQSGNSKDGKKSDNQSSANSESKSASPGTGSGTGSSGTDKLEMDQWNEQNAKKRAELALEKLSSQKEDPDQELLDRLGWTEEEFKTFLDRWQQMKDAAQKGDAKAKRKYKRAIQSLNLNPSQTIDSIKQTDEKVTGLNVDSEKVVVPPRLRRNFESFQADLQRIDR